MVVYRLSPSQDETWKCCWAAQAELAQALSALLTTLIEGHWVLVLDQKGTPLFVAEGGEA